MRTAEHQQNAAFVQREQKAQDRARRDARPRERQPYFGRDHPAVGAQALRGFDQTHIDERRVRNERRTHDERRVEHDFRENHAAENRKSIGGDSSEKSRCMPMLTEPCEP